ncbi:alpha/beta fold hydrolase [Ornithinibacillus californiensis]|uniref:alpha/beta fold hydrolase n=1 Tax=Ornithinibacillus californiensis TaxID=161536 RepID=UPI00064DCFC3|nr:alpha/beta fold hydrolase [Ornithinibacillus californiensis]
MNRLIKIGLVSILMIGSIFLSAITIEANDDTRVQDDVYFTMDDGTEIVGSVYLPPESMKVPKQGYPLIVMVHGWGGDRTQMRFPEFARKLANDGYAVLTYDTRGFGQSGDPAKIASKRELKDLHSLLYFVLDNRNSYEDNATSIYSNEIKINPQEIGMTGVSYGGGHAYLAAASNYDPYTYVLPDGLVITDPRNQLSDPIRYPKVKTIAPIVGWTDLYQALYPNGVMKMSYDTGLALLALGNADPLIYELLTYAATGVNDEAIREMAEERSILLDGEFVNQNMEENSIYEVPIYMLQAWEDYLFPAEQAIDLYKKLDGENSNVKLYLGNTGHPPASLNMETGEVNYMFQSIHEWFNYWLKGEKQLKVLENRVEIAPEPGTYEESVTVGEWIDLLRTYHELPTVNNLSFYLQRNQKLALRIPLFPQATDLMITNPFNGIEDDPILGEADPNDFLGTLSGVTDVNLQLFNLKVGNVYYYSEPLDEDLIVFGQPELTIFGATNGDSIQLSAKFYDVDHQGNATLMTRGVNKFSSTFPFVPAKSEFQTFADYHVYKQGHRIMVELGAVDFPAYRSNLTQITTSIFHDNSLPSKIEIPVLE